MYLGESKCKAKPGKAEERAKKRCAKGQRSAKNFNGIEILQSILSPEFERVIIEEKDIHIEENDDKSQGNIGDSEIAQSCAIDYDRKTLMFFFFKFIFEYLCSPFLS